MTKSTFRKYNIAGEHNPCWIMAEPILLKIWADGILRTPYLNLQFANVFCIIVHVTFFLGGASLRIAAVMAVLIPAYLAFPQTLSVSFEAIFGADFDPSSVNNLWLYRLLGYVIMIKASLFLLGGLAMFLRDVIFYLALMLTNMLPLRIIARSLQNDRYFGQYIAKASFMGTYMVQTMTATPLEDRNKWDKVFNLYMNSNQVFAREELERLSSEFSNCL